MKTRYTFMTHPCSNVHIHETLNGAHMKHIYDKSLIVNNINKNHLQKILWQICSQKNIKCDSPIVDMIVLQWKYASTASTCFHRQFQIIRPLIVLRLKYVLQCKYAHSQSDRNELRALKSAIENYKLFFQNFLETFNY